LKTLIRCLLSLRYRVQLEGLEQVNALTGATLIMPNHPAYIDPLLLITRLSLYRPLRPLVYSGTYRMKLLRPLMKMASALEVPDLTRPNRQNHRLTCELIQHTIERLRAGDCILIYPSGRLQRGDREVVGAARAAYELICRVPEANIVLVRTRGLWGSRFSCTAAGELPNLARQTRSAALWTLASFIFWLPRRHVTMQLQVVDRSQLPLNDRRSFNAFLEKWYNAEGAQPPKFVRYHHWFGPRKGQFKPAHRVPVELSSISLETIQRVNQMLENLLGRTLASDELQANIHLENLGLDSLDCVELMLQIQSHYGHHEETVPETLAGLWRFADNCRRAS